VGVDMTTVGPKQNAWKGWCNLDGQYHSKENFTTHLQDPLWCI